jgi:HSP20 family protein
MSTALEHRSDNMFRRLAEWLDMPDPVRLFSTGRVGDMMMPGRLGDMMMRLEETAADGMLTIKAELPGIDPDKDVEITVGNGLLTIAAERREDTTEDRDGTRVSEFRYGSFSRTLAVPKDVDSGQITAAYTDGILTVTVPTPVPVASGVAKVPIARK